MNWYFVVSLALSFAAVILGVLAVAREPREPLHRLFGLMTLSLAWWNLWFGCAKTFTDLNDVWLAYRLSSVGWITSTPLLLASLHLFAGRPHRAVLREFAFFLAAGTVFFYPVWFDHLLVRDIVVQAGGNQYVPAAPGLWFALYEVWVWGQILYGLVWLVRAAGSTPYPRYRGHLQLLFWCTVGANLIIFAVNIVLPRLVGSVPAFGQWMAAVPHVVFFFLIYRYRFFSWDRLPWAPVLGDLMKDPVLIIDRDRRVVQVNRAAETFFGRSLMGGIGEPLDLWLTLPAEAEEAWAHPGTGEDLPVVCRAEVLGLEVDLDFRFRRDASGAPAGAALLLEAREPSVRLALRYGLSQREREIASALARGLKNQEIAEENHISLSTVKTHVHRILTKTGSAGRAELVALMMGEAAASCSD